MIRIQNIITTNHLNVHSKHHNFSTFFKSNYTLSKRNIQLYETTQKENSLKIKKEHFVGLDSSHPRTTTPNNVHSNLHTSPLKIHRNPRNNPTIPHPTTRHTSTNLSMHVSAMEESPPSILLRKLNFRSLRAHKHKHR